MSIRRDVERWLRLHLRDVQAARRARTWFSYSARREEQDARQLRLILALTLAPDSNCIDVGCHSGAVLAEMVRLAPNGKHIAYEPLPEECADVRDRFPGVDVRQAALSDVEGESSFVHVRDSPSLSGLRARAFVHDHDVHEITVRTERLDDSLPSDYHPTLIKIDVEGAERQVIGGALETIRRHKPVIVFEHGKGAAPSYGTAPDDVFNLLSTQAGLRIFDLDGNGPFTAAQFAHVFDAGRHWNFIARR